MRDYPLIKFTLAFIIGIVVSGYIDFQILHLSVTLLMLIVVSILLNFIKFNYRDVVISLLVLFLISLSGIIYYKSHTIDKPIYPFKDHFVKDVLLDGRVDEIQLPSDKLTLTLKVDRILKENNKTEIDFNVLLHLYYDEKEIDQIISKLQPGNRIVILGSLSIPPNERNPNDFNYREYLADKGITAILNSYSSFDFVIVDYEREFINSAIFNARYFIANKIKSIYSPQTAGLLKGLLLADRSEISYDVKDGFIKSGVIHVLAVSGLHVGFIILILLFLLGRFNIYLRIAFTILGLFAFVIITGLPPSVTRASIMASLILISFLRSNKQSNYNTLALAALIILVFDPHQVFNPGFQLSFSAVLSIFIFLPNLKRLIERRITTNKSISFLLLFISVSIAAQIGTLPFTVYYFQKFSIISIIANLYIIPIIGFILALGILTLVLSLVSFPLNSLYILVNEGIVESTFEIISIMSSLPFSYLEFPNYSVWDGLVYLVLLALFTRYFKELVSLKTKLIFVLLIVFNLAVWSKVDDTKILPDGKLSILVVDVGQSESAIVKFPSNKLAVINFGSASSEYSTGSQTIVPLLKLLELDQIDYGIISHFSRRKYLGVLDVIENIKHDSLFIPKISGHNSELELFNTYLNERNVNWEIISGNKIDFENSRIYLFPHTSMGTNDSMNVYNLSAGIKITYGNTSILFMGGIEKRGEVILNETYNKFLESDILHVANYGSDVSTSSELINVVKPKYSVISVGLGNYMNYPSNSVIDLLSAHDSQILRTDELGAILFVSDGEKIEQIDWRKN